jgi:type IV secretion system protein VirD4
MDRLILALLRPLIPIVARGLALVCLAELPGLLWILLVDEHGTHPGVVGALDGLALVAIVALYIRHRGGWLRSLALAVPDATSQGSAHWGDGRALRAPTGLILGRLGGEILRLDGEGHILTVAPTGSGKGVSAVIPNLLSYPGSVLVTDPKGENFAVTARRRCAVGSRVLALDPFGVVGGAATFNPLAALDADAPDAVDDGMRLADALVIETGRESADAAFWNEEAKGLLTGLILHAVASEPPERRTLATVWDYLSRPPRELLALWIAMGKSPAAHGAVARAAARFRQKADRVRAGILAQAQSHTHFLESPRLTAVMQRSSFRFEDLKTDRMTLYLIVPPHRLDVCRRWLRLLVACAVHALERAPGLPADRVLLLLDEFPALGRMLPIERAVTLLRGYGVTFWLVAQDFAQLRTTYPDTWRSLHAAADVLQAFGANDWETADYLSRLAGETTVPVATQHRSRGRSRPPGALLASVQAGTATGATERARRLITADEVRCLPRDRALLFLRGADPLCVDRVNYLTDAAFKGQFDTNPLHRRLAV